MLKYYTVHFCFILDYYYYRNVCVEEAILNKIPKCVYVSMYKDMNTYTIIHMEICNTY